MRLASCRCGAVTAECEGEPVRISVCHGLARQQGAGSAFGVEARYRADQLVFGGSTAIYERVSDSGQRTTYHFCPNCRSTVWYVDEGQADRFAIPVGAFADPLFPAPELFGYEHRRHPSVAIVGRQS